MRGLERGRLYHHQPPEHRRRRLVEVRQPAHRWRNQRLLRAARPAALAVRRQRQVPEGIARLQPRYHQQVHQQRADKRPRHEPAVSQRSTECAIHHLAYIIEGAPNASQPPYVTNWLQDGPPAHRQSHRVR